MSNFKNPFGLKNGELVHIKDIYKGDEIYCPECGDRLIVREGAVTRKHLAHKFNTNNNCSSESIIHKYTKIYLSDTLEKIKIFNDRIIVSDGKFKLSESQFVSIKNIEVEYSGLSNEYIPDLFLKLENNEEVAIEICYKNPKDKSYLQEILPKLNINQVYEIIVTEEDLVNFDMELILDRAELVYNQIGNEFDVAKNKMMYIYYRNESLEKYSKMLIDEIRSLRSKVDGRYIKRTQRNFINEKIRLENEIRILKKPNESLDKLITTWKSKIFNKEQRVPSGNVKLMESDLREIFKYYYDLEQQLYKFKRED